jgi:hypothetical protein
VCYEFDPDGSAAARYDDYDANWLLIHMTANDGQRQWSAIQPAFLTWELHSLVRWLRAWADRVPYVEQDTGGIEPNLHFEAKGLGSEVIIRAVFDLEFNPPERRSRDTYEGAVAIDFEPGVAGIHTFADEIEDALRAFPIRLRQADGPAMREIRWLGVSPEFVQAGPGTSPPSSSLSADGSPGNTYRPGEQVQIETFLLRVYGNVATPSSAWGEGELIAPNGGKAYLVWTVFPDAQPDVIRGWRPMDRQQWGTWYVSLGTEVRTPDDLRRQVALILPELERRWEAWRQKVSAQSQ